MGARQVYEKIGDQILNQTATAKKGEISPRARKILETGPLRYQVDLYNLIKSLYQGQSSILRKNFDIMICNLKAFLFKSFYNYKFSI